MKININKRSVEVIEKRFNEMDGIVVRIGIAGKAREQIGEWLEYGTSKLEAIPFLRPVLFEASYLKKAMKMAFNGWKNGEGSLAENFKDKLVYMVKEYISDLKPGMEWRGHIARKLAPSTIKAKGSDKLLIDTTTLFHSIDGDVISKG